MSHFSEFMMGTPVLVIDDNTDNREVFVGLLRRIGCEVFDAETGTQGISVAHDTPGIRFALIDYDLPDTNGIKVLTAIKETCPEMVLAILTVNDEPTVINKAFAAGADYYVVKPNGFMALYNALKTGEINLLDCHHQPTLIDARGIRVYNMRKNQPTLPSIEQNGVEQ